MLDWFRLCIELYVLCIDTYCNVLHILLREYIHKCNYAYMFTMYVCVCMHINMYKLYRVLSYSCIGPLVFLTSAITLSTSILECPVSVIRPKRCEGMKLQLPRWQVSVMILHFFPALVSQLQSQTFDHGTRNTLGEEPQWNRKHVHWTFWCCGMDSFSQRFQDLKHWPKTFETWALLLMVSWL